MDYSSLDDESLIRHILDKESAALSALYDRYSRLVFSLALHSVGDQETAEEITQDVFFRVWDKAATYRPGQAKVSTWLVSIARYRAIDVLRQRGARPEQYSLSWEELTPAATPIAPGEPEDLTQQSLDHQRVRAAVHSLPEDQKHVLALAYFQGLSHSQIADRLGEPLGTVKTRIRLAMQKLRDLLGDEAKVRH